MGDERGGWASPRVLAEPRNDMAKGAFFGWQGVRDIWVGSARHNVSKLRTRGWGGCGCGGRGGGR